MKKTQTFITIALVALSLACALLPVPTGKKAVPLVHYYLVEPQQETPQPGSVTILPYGLPQPMSLTSISAGSDHVLPPSLLRVTHVSRGLSSEGTYLPLAS